MKDINETVEWLYEDASKSATKDQLQNKLFVFKTIGEPIKRRHAYYDELDVYFRQFEKICEGIQSQFNKYPLLSDHQRSEIMSKHHEVSEFMENVKADRKEKRLDQDPAFTID